MDSFLSAHSMGFYGDEKAKVLKLYHAFNWHNDRVKPIEILDESPHTEGGRNWKNSKCRWEFSQNSGMDPQLTWRKR